MKIAMIGTKGFNFGQNAFGGFETVITELAPRLVAAGHEVTVYCRDKLYSGGSRPETVSGVHLRFLSSIETKNLGTMSHSLLSVVDAIARGTEVMFLFNIGLGIYLPLIKMLGVKVVTNLDGVEWKRGKWGGLAKTTFLVGAAINRIFADVLVADSVAIADIYSEKFRADSVVIPYGAEMRSDLSSDRIRELGLVPGGYYLLATRFIPENNPLFIIKSYLRSKTSKPLVVLGRNYYRSGYEDKIRQITDCRVRFMGHITDRTLLLEFYRYSYVYLHGHSVGGTNPTMLEALANSSCILALDTPFNREMLSEGRFGMFFKLDGDSLVNGINLLDVSPGLVACYKDSSQERIKEYYNWSAVTEQYLHLLESLHRS